MPKPRQRFGGYTFNNYVAEMRQHLLSAAAALKDFSQETRKSRQIKSEQALKIAEAASDLVIVADLLQKLEEIARADGAAEKKVIDYPQDRVVGGNDE